MAAKEMAKEVIETLPDSASMDDIIHALYVREKFARGQEEYLRGEFHTHEEVKKRLERWLK